MTSAPRTRDGVTVSPRSTAPSTGPRDEDRDRREEQTVRERREEISAYADQTEDGTAEQRQDEQPAQVRRAPLRSAAQPEP
jgi:hypothetical protein